MTLYDTPIDKRRFDTAEDVSQEFEVRYLTVEDDPEGRLSPRERLEHAVETSGDNEGAVYYDGGTAFMNVSSPGPDDLSDLVFGIQNVVRALKDARLDD